MIRNTIIIAIIALMFACNTEKQKDTSKITISGKLVNANGDKIFLLEGRKRTEIEVSDSTFTLKLPANGSGIVKSIGNADNLVKCFLMPGDSVFITYDAATKEYLTSGDNVLANKYLKLQKENSKEHLFNPWPKFDLGIDEFTTVMDSLLGANNTLLDNFVIENPKITKDFIYYEKANINYQVYLYKSYYPESYSYNTKDTIDPKSDYFNFEKSIDLNDYKLLNSENYQQCTGFIINDRAGKLTENDSTYNKISNPIVVSRLEIIKKEIKNKDLLNYHLHSLMKMQLDYYATKGIESVYTYFLDNCSNKEYLSEIDSLKKEWEKLGKGMNSYNFSALDINGKSYTQDDFKGKYIFLDCWATWCGPCKGEIPFLESIIDEYKNKNIVFISLSFDNNKKDWDNWMNTKETKGYQLYLEKEEKTKLAGFYKVSGIPRFILIDTEGKIFDAQAPRPSGDLKNLLNNLENI